MKKILSLLLAVMMIASMSVMVSAANNDGTVVFVANKTEVTVGETFTVSVKVIGDTDSSVVCTGGSLQLVAGSNATVDSVAVGAAASAFSTQQTYTTLATKKQNVSDTVGFAGDGELIVATFTATSVGEFTVSANQPKFTFKTGATTTPYYCRAIDPITITVKAAEPVIEYEEKGDALTADKSVEAADGKTKWNDLAIYKASFDLDKVVAEKGYGFDVNGTKNAITINGEGTVDYVLAFFGVAADKVPTVSTYYTVVK